MTSRICVINGKDGCGKTTVSTHLAGALANSGLATLLVDLDRHRGARRWHKLRPKSATGIHLSNWKKHFGETPKNIQRVIIDCPASLCQVRVREVVAESDILIVPLLPSVFDQHATKLFLNRLMTIKKVRKGRKALLIVSNRHRTRSFASKQLDSFLEKLGLKPFVYISDSSAYDNLAALGLTVFDKNTKSMHTLQEEWMPLIEEIEAIGREEVA